MVRIVNYKKHFVSLLGDLEADITEGVKVPREEVYGVKNKKTYQDSFTVTDVYNRLSQITFDSDDSDNPGVWAGMDQINSYINNQAIKTSANGDELAYYICPNNFGFDSTEGIKDIAKHICRRDGIANSFYGAKESLDKPFIVISNTATVLAQSSTDVNQQGGIHWISWVLLPKKYVSLSGKEINNDKYQILFFDSLSQNSFPEGLKKFLIEGGEIIEKTDEGEKQIRLMPFCAKEEIDFKNIKDLTGQQINGNDCGWWATYYALMSVYTGGVGFLESLKGKKLSAKPLRGIMSLQESIEEQPKKQERPNPSNSKLEQSPGLLADRVKKVNNDPNQEGFSQQLSPDNRQSGRGNQAIDSAQHQQINPNSSNFIDSDDERGKNRELFSAIKSDDVQKVQKLLKSGVKVNIIDKNNKDNTPLHYAVERDKKEIVEKLLEEWKADINAKNNKGDTPLHVAVSKGHQDIVGLLLKKGAKTDIKNSRGRTPLLQASEESRGRKRTQNEENELGAGQAKKLKTSRGYSASGLKSSLHGTAYQLKLLMLFLKRGLDQGYSFNLATEMDAAEKFDDIVFQYTEGGEEVYRFLQAKHKQNDNKKITVNDLLTEQDDEFSLQKYFISYRKIKQNPEFKGYKLKDFVICTNIDLEESLRNSFEPVEGEDNILRFNGEKSERLKLKVDKFPNEKDLVSRLSKTSELNRLAKRPAECVFKDKPLDLKDNLFRSYHGVLGEKVIDVKSIKQREDNKGKKKSYAKFHSDFLNRRSQELENFRSAFLKAYRDISKEQMDVNEFWQKMRARKLQISQTFGKLFELDTDPQLTDSKMFAKAIVDSINRSDRGVVVIKREKSKSSIIKDNISKLAGYVLIKNEGDEEKDIYYFSSAFFDDNNKLPGNLENFKSELKAELKRECIEFGRNKYKFRIADFKTCEEERLHSKPLLPDDHIDEEEIESFFEKLVFAVNQPNEIELGNIIEAEMGEEKDINLIDSELIASKFQKDMLDWMKEKRGRFISCKDGKNFFKEAKQKLSKLVLIGPTLEYRAKIEDFSIDFSEKPSGLSEFLASHKRQIFNLVNPHKTILSSIKVCQTLKDIPDYKRDDSHIFARLSSLLRIQNLVIQAFQSETSNNLIVIECKSAEKNVDQLYSQLSKVIESNNNKKVILITQEKDSLANKLTQEQDPLAAKFKEYSPNKYIETRDGKSSLTDLTDSSQKELLEKGKVIFQGKEVSLGKLVDDRSKHLIDGEILSKLINNEEIKIGRALTDSKYDDVKDYYIDRTLNCQVKIKKGLKKENSGFLVTNNGQINGKNLKEDQDIVLISDTSENFKDLCNEYKEHNIHWLKEAGDDLIWQQSYGALSKLREFVRKDALSILEYKPEGITDIKDRVVVISAEPGMGKSTVLNPLALKTKDSLWVIRINLLDYSTELKEETEKKTKLDEAEAIKFLYRIVGFQLFQKEKEETTEKKKEREETIEEVLSAITVKDSEVSLEGAGKKIKVLELLEIGLFNNFYNQGRIVLLFDGLDEISPYYTEKVIELLQVLKNSKVEKLWITTRPYNFVQEKLEDQLSVFSYLLKPLLPEEQKGFFRKFWKAKLKLSELDEQRSGVFIDELLDRLPGSIGDKDFMSIPLHTFMVAEAFKNGFKSFYDSNEQELSDKYKRKIEELDLVTLYEKFIDIKFYEIRFGEKEPGTNTDVPGMRRIVEKERKEFIEDHIKLALYAMFNEDEVKELLSQEEIGKVTELIEQIKQATEKAGIIDRVINDKPRFVHLTFAEYFVASYFWESFKSVQFDKFEDFVENIIIKNLIKDDRIQISKFLQLKAKKDLESNINFPDKQNKLRTLLTKLLDRTHRYGPYENNKQSTKLLWGIVEFSLSTEEESSLEVIENNDQLKLLCVSAEMGYIKLVEALETKLNKEFLQKYLKFDKWFYSPLWLAAQNAHLDVLGVLVKKFSYDPNWKDKDSKTLVQRIFEMNEFDVLRSCLKLDIIDGKPYEDLNCRQELPIVKAFNAVAPSDVIKLLIEKTDSNLVNRFRYSESSSDISPTQWISMQLLKYDKEITELAIEKGIDFSQATNLLLFEYCYESLNSPINKLISAHFGQPSFHSDKEFLNLFEIIELLLKAGVGYNQKDTQHNTTTLQYAEQIHYIHKLLDGVHKLHNQKIDKSSNPLDTILKLIIFSTSSAPHFVDYKIVVDSKQIALLPNYKAKSSKGHSSPLILGDIPELLFKFYKDSSTNLVKNALNKLRSYTEDARKEIKKFEQYPDSKVYNKIFIGYEEMLEYYGQRKDKLKFESLKLPVKGLLERVLKLYIRQDYEINDALKEVEGEVLRLKEIINRLKENSGREKYETEEILNILDMKSIDINEGLQGLISKINECGGTQLLSETWKNLNLIGKKRVMSTLELMFKFADQSSKIFKLLKKLDSGYKMLTGAIENENYREIDNILQNVEPDFIKAVINGQDDEYGSPLHYAAFKGDVQVTEILLESGANPNLKMQGSGILFSTADETQKDEDLSPEDYKGCTPLHLAALNGQLKVAEILVNCGADVNAGNKDEETPLHWAASSGNLSVVEFLVKKGADVNAMSTSWKGGTPLHMASESGKLDVVNFLVEKGADVNAKDKYGKTPISLARDQEIVNFLWQVKLQQRPQVYRKEEKVYLDLLKFVSSNIPSIEIQSVKQGLYLNSFDVRGVKVNGKCSAITRHLSQSMFLKDPSLKLYELFLNNLKTSAEIYERIAQGKQISQREEEEVFALSKFINNFEQQLNSPTSSLPSSLTYTKSYKTLDDLSFYVAKIKGDFAIHLVTSNHVVAVYRVGDNYSYFDTNVSFVSGMKTVQELMKVVEKAVKLADYELAKEGFLVEYFNIAKANSQLSNEDKKALIKEIKTERQLLAEQDKEFGLIKINGQEISRVQLYDFGTKINVEGSVPLLINAGMNLNSKNFSEYLSAGKISMTAREYLDSLKDSRNVKEAVQATKFIPFIGSKSEVEKAEQIRKLKGSLAKETINCILSAISLVNISCLKDQLSVSTSTKPDSYLSEVKVDNQPGKSLFF